MTKYNLNNLKEINLSYNGEHRITESDVEKANKWVEIIENTRDNNSPQVGDIVEYTDRHGNYYRNAHIEKVTEDGIEICEHPYVPFIGLIGKEKRLYTSTSGGAWDNISNNLKLIGTREKTFTDWGHCGACGNGAIEFKAVVNVWEYIDPDQLYKGFSTKDFDKHHIGIREPKERLDYKYTTDGKAWRTDKDYKAWLKTFNGVEFAGHWGEGSKIVWTHKEITKYVSLDEYNNVDGIVDSILNNGSIWECKRVYENNQVITYLIGGYENRIKLDYSTPQNMAAYNTL